MITSIIKIIYNIVSLETAKQKLKHAENSSNLSSADEHEISKTRLRTIHKRKKNGSVSNPPKFNSSKYLKGILHFFLHLFKIYHNYYLRLLQSFFYNLLFR